MIFLRKLALAAVTLGGLAAAGCSSIDVKTTDHWEGDAHQGAPYKHTLFVGITADPGMRGVVERGYAERMTSGNYTLTAGADLMPPSGRITKEMILRYTKDTDIDSVLTVLMLNYEADHTNRGPYYVDPRMAWNSTSYRVESMLGYGGVTGSDAITLRYSFFDLKTETLIWTADSTIRNATNAEQIMKHGEPDLAKALKASGLIP